VAEHTPLFCLVMLSFWILLVRVGQELCRWRHLSRVAKPTEKIAVNTIPGPPPPVLCQMPFLS